MEPTQGNLDLTRQLLERLGFELRWRQGDWWTCAVLGAGAAVLGHGVDRAAALEHALAQMLPHPLARSLWQERLASASQAGPDASLAGPSTSQTGPSASLAGPSTSQTGPSASLAPSSEGSRASAAPPQPELAPQDARRDARQHAPQDAPPPSPTAEQVPSAAPPTAILTATDAAPPADGLPEPAQPPPDAVAAEPPQVQPPPAAMAAPLAKPEPRRVDLARVDDALEALAALERDVEDTQDFALLSASLMRLQLVTWIALARDWQDRLGDELVTQRVSGLAARLGALARRYWPGQVAALRLDARPADCAAMVGGEPRSWAEVAELAEQAMAAAMAVDEYGWADTAKLGPQPADPRSRLGEAQATLRRLLPGAEEPGSPIAVQRAQDLRANPPVKELASVARMLRWLRLSADPEPWGRAMGWLRWLTQRLGQALPPALIELLQPETLPSRDWARENGFSPQRGELRRLLAELPPPEAGAEPLVAWLLRSYKLVNAEQLAERLTGHRALVLALDAQQSFPGDGTARDRLRKVQKRLAGLTGQPAAPLPVEPAEQAERPDPSEAGPVAKARLLLEGKRGLVLGNRADPHLDRHLREGLGFAHLDWCLTDNGSSVDAASDRVRNRGYAVVLALTGFISHTSEGVLRQACASAEVPFVRAGKGRLVGCAIAVLRDIGAAER